MTGDGREKTPGDTEGTRRRKLERWGCSSGWEHSLAAAERLAHECIDYNYLVERKEVELGRELETNELKPSEET